MSELLIVTLTLMTLVSIIALLVGGMIGWMARQHSYETTPQMVYSHPEMFDSNGNILPDEILALRIENNHETEINDDDDSEP
tara:strand:- start:1222 stop:1467 length:246 start_codon:yes stop_codon:yes gene_type:complete